MGAAGVRISRAVISEKDMTKKALGWLVAMLVTATAAFAQGDAAKEQEKAAKDKIAEFKKESRKFKTDEDWIGGIKKLGELKHEKVLKELCAMAKAERREPVLQALLDEIAKYANDEFAASTLLSLFQQWATLAKRNKDGTDVGHDMAVKILQALGQVKHKPTAKKLEEYYTNANVELARQAIGAVGEIGNLESVERLILQLKDLEAQQVPQGVPGSPPTGPPGAPPGGPPGMPPGGLPPNAQNGMQQEAQRRKQALEPVIKESLRRITGHDEPDSSKWSGWWSKNKAELFKKAKEAEKGPGK